MTVGSSTVSRPILDYRDEGQWTSTKVTTQNTGMVENTYGADVVEPHRLKYKRMIK